MTPSPSLLQRPSPSAPSSSHPSTPGMSHAPASGSRGGLSDKAMNDRVNGLLEEYMKIHDPAEALLSLQELPRAAAGLLVLKVVHRTLNTTRKEVHEDMLQLFVELSSALREAQEDVLNALMRCEELSMLVDSITDFREAPEWIGAIVGVLVKVGACSMDRVGRMVEQMKRAEMERDPDCPPPEDVVNRAYGAFLAAVKARAARA